MTNEMTIDSDVYFYLWVAVALMVVAMLPFLFGRPRPVSRSIDVDISTYTFFLLFALPRTIIPDHTFTRMFIKLVTFSVLITITFLAGRLFTVTLSRVCRVKQELPANSPSESHARRMGILFNYLALITVGIWLAQLTISTIYCFRNVFMNKPRELEDLYGFPFAAYYLLSQLTYLFVVATILQLGYYRRSIYPTILPPASLGTKILNAGILVYYFGQAVSTTFFLTFYKGYPRGPEAKFIHWIAMTFMVLNIVFLVHVSAALISIWSLREWLKPRVIVDEPLEHISMIDHHWLVYVLAPAQTYVYILYGEARFSTKTSIDLDAVRLFEVLLHGLFYFTVIRLLVAAGNKSQEGNKDLRVEEDEETGNE